MSKANKNNKNVPDAITDPNMDALENIISLLGEIDSIKNDVEESKKDDKSCRDEDLVRLNEELKIRSDILRVQNDIDRSLAANESVALHKEILKLKEEMNKVTIDMEVRKEVEKIKAEKEKEIMALKLEIERAKANVTPIIQTVQHSPQPIYAQPQVFATQPIYAQNIEKQKSSEDYIPEPTVYDNLSRIKEDVYTLLQEDKPESNKKDNKGGILDFEDEKSSNIDLSEITKKLEEGRYESDIKIDNLRQDIDATRFDITQKIGEHIVDLKKEMNRIANGDEVKAENPAIAEFKKGDNTLVLENIYDSIIEEIENLKDAGGEIDSNLKKVIFELKSEINNILGLNREESTKGDNEIKELLKDIKNDTIEKALDRTIFDSIKLEIADLKNAITRERDIGYQQDLSIYTDITEKLEEIGKASDIQDIKNLLTNVAQKDMVEQINSKISDNLESKIVEMSNNANSINVDEIVDKLKDKIEFKEPVETYETLELTKSLGIKLDETKVKVDSITPFDPTDILKQLSEIKDTVDALKGGRNSSEFGLLDYEIAEYEKDSKLSILSEILVSSRDLKIKAQKFFDNGSTVNGAAIMEGLSSRLKTIYVAGSKGLGEIMRLSSVNRVPISIENTSLLELNNLYKKFEEASLLPNIDLMNDIMRTKRNVFKNVPQTTLDKDTFIGMSSEMSGVEKLSEITEDKAELLKTYKVSLMRFPLSLVFDFSTNRENAGMTDTDLLLSELRAIREELKERPVMTSATMVKNETISEEEMEDLSSLTDELKTLSEQGEKNIRRPKLKVLRPAVTKKDGEVEKVRQPLAVRRNSIKSAIDDPDSLSNLLAHQVAKNLTDKWIKS